MRDFCLLFREVPQAIHFVHSFRTARLRFTIDEKFILRESAVTAGVDVTLLIAQRLVLSAVSQRVNCWAVPEACKRCG